MRKLNTSSKILSWYDKNARALPWRIPPIASKNGILADPYKVWLSEIMLQQTTVKAVIPYYEKFISKWPDLASLSAAPAEDIMNAWAGLGYYSRARNLLNCARLLVNKYDAKFPETEKYLIKLPGIGPYTAAAIRSIAFNKKAIVIDGNINRLIVRIFSIQTPIKKSEKEIKSFASILSPSRRFGDYAQALMDIGSTICTPRNPKCQICPIKLDCSAHKLGIEHKIPTKEKRKLRKTRYGFVYIIASKDNSFLLKRQPNNGLLGGMLVFHSSAWTVKEPKSFKPPFDGKWIIHKNTIEHTFSHFDLKLRPVSVFLLEKPEGFLRYDYNTFDPTGLPSVMKKVFQFMVESYKCV